MTLGIWCTALGKVCSKLTYALQAFSTPKVHIGVCARLAGYLFRCVTVTDCIL